MFLSSRTMTELFILVPVHNRRDITTQFARDLAAQKGVNFTLILIDDGSTDGTADAVREILPGTIVLTGNGDLWWGGSLDKAVKHLKTQNLTGDEMLLILNDDVLLSPNFLETGMRLMQGSERSLLLARHLDPEKNIVVESGVHCDPQTMAFSLADAKTINCLSTRGLFLRWKDMLAIGGFRPALLPHYASDYEFTMRAHKKGLQLWTHPDLWLIPMPELSGYHKIAVDRGALHAWRAVFSYRNPNHPWHRSVLICLSAKPNQIPRLIGAVWYCNLQIVLRALKNSVRRGILNRIEQTYRRKDGRLQLGLLSIGSTNWIAGQIYVRNVLLALNSLPEGQRPHIRVIRGIGADPDILKELASHDNVSLGIWTRLAAAGNRRLSEKITRLTRGSLRRILGPAADPELWGLDVIFPALGSAPESVPQIKWIPDFQHKHLPELFTPAERDQRDQLYAEIAQQDGILLLSSRAALADFQTFYPNARIKPRVWSFCSVLPEIDFAKSSHAISTLPSKYLYLPGQFWAHKNHRLAFEALYKLKHDHGLTIPLVCTGLERDYRDPDHVPRLKAFLAEAEIKGQVQFLGLVPRHEQIEIFRRAAAVLQPSLFEGWSTVVEDAKALGRPILLSSIEVHKEQSPKDARFFDPYSAQDLCNLLKEIWPELNPGPDSEREHSASLEIKARLIEAGHSLMEIFYEAVKFGKS